MEDSKQHFLKKELHGYKERKRRAEIVIQKVYMATRMPLKAAKKEASHCHYQSS